jgi:hypothetical protein
MKAGSTKSFPSAYAGFLLLGLLFIPEDGGDMVLQLVGEIHGFTSHNTTVVIEFSQVKGEPFPANYIS